MWAARRLSGCARELAKTSDINVNSAPGAGAAGGQQPPAPLAGRSEATVYERGGPLDAARVAAAPQGFCIRMQHLRESGITYLQRNLRGLRGIPAWVGDPLGPPLGP